MKDVIIIGAGVVGSAIAREISRYAGDMLVIERGPDVCEGTSKANSGIAHAGYDAKPGTLKAKLNVEGSRMMEPLSKELDFPYVRNTSLVLALREEDRETMKKLFDQGVANGVEGLRIIEADEPEVREAFLETVQFVAENAHASKPFPHYYKVIIG